MLFPYNSHYALTIARSLRENHNLEGVSKYDILIAIERSCAGHEGYYQEHGAFKAYLALFGLALFQCPACGNQFVTAWGNDEPGGEEFCSFSCYSRYFGGE